MMNLQRLLSLKKISIVLVITFFCLSCETEKKEQKFIAKADDSLLTSDGISDLQKIKENHRLVKGELARNWAESLVIKKEAEKSGIYDSEEFIRVINETKVKLAESILLRKYVEENFEVPNQSILQKFYDEHNDNFILQNDGFTINLISFRNENDAVKFRNYLIKTDWNRAVNKIEDHNSIKSIIESRFFFVNNFYNDKILNVINRMEDGETSIIIESEPDDYKIVQVLKKFDKFSLPEFDYIKDLVNERYKIKRTQELHQDYLNKLYDKYNVEIKSEQ